MAQSMPLAGTAHGASAAGPKLLALFSLPFCGVGIFMAWTLLVALGRGEPLEQELVLRGVFALVFGGAGFGLLAFARHAQRRAAQIQSLRRQHPEEPWRWRPEWSEGRIGSQDGASAILAWAFASFWNLLLAPLWFEPPAELPFFVWLFPAVGVGLLVWAIRASLRRRKFGNSRFEMDTFPGVVGGTLRGTVHVPAAVRPEQGFETRLSCVNRVTTGSGKNRSTHEKILWQEQRCVATTAAPATPLGTAIGVDFTIPHDVAPTGERSARDEVLWRLEVRADVPGVDLHAIFEVPVFRTAESSESAGPVRPAEPIAALSLEPASLAGDPRVRVARDPQGGVEIHFPAPRSASTAFVLTLFTLFWNGFVIGMGTLAPAPIWLFLSIFALVGLLLALLTIDAWVGSRRIRVRPGELCITRKWLGIGGTTTYQAETLTELAVEVNGHVGNRVFYAIKGRRPDRKLRPVLAGGFFDRREAERVLDLLRRGLAGEAI